MYIKEHLSFKVFFCRAKWIMYVFSISEINCPVCLSTFYRPPSSPVSIFDSLLNVLGSLNPSLFSNLIFLDDINVNLLSHSSHLA